MDSKTLSPVSLDNKKCFEIDSGPSFDGENERVEKKNEIYAFMCRTSVEFLHEHIFQDCTLEHNMNLGKDISSGF